MCTLGNRPVYFYLHNTIPEPVEVIVSKRIFHKLKLFDIQHAVSIPENIFSRWFSNIELKSISMIEEFNLEVPDKLHADWIDEHYGELISNALKKSAETNNITFTLMGVRHLFGLCTDADFINLCFAAYRSCF